MPLPGGEEKDLKRELEQPADSASLQVLGHLGLDVSEAEPRGASSQGNKPNEMINQVVIKAERATGLDISKAFALEYIFSK